MIDEKKLIEVLKKHFDADYGEDGRLLYSDHVCTSDDVEDIIKLVEEQPRVGEWTPCSERLPEEPEENPMFEGAKVELYLVSAGKGFYPFRAFWNGEDFTDGLGEVYVEAWMPLPPAYKEGE